MSRRTLRLLVILALWAATTLPHLVGWARATSAQAYLGRIPSNPADTVAYYSNIEQAKQGRLLFANQLTSEAQQPSMLHPLWLMTGWLAWLGDWSAPLAFHLVRLFAIVWFVFFLDRLLVRLLPDPRTQVLALVMVTTSSGLGWMFAQSAYLGSAILSAPIDLWVDEANTFRSLSHSALFVVSQLLLFAVVWRLYRWTQDGRQGRDWLIGPVLALLGLIHPYDLVTAAALTFVWVVVWWSANRPDVERRKVVLRSVILSWLWVVPVAVYYLAGPMQELAVRGWFIQNINLSPKPLAVIVGYGLLWPLALVGAVTSWARHRWVTFAVIWIATVLVLTYMPGLSIQRRLLSGLHLPIALLATLGLQWCMRRAIVPRWQTATTVLVLVFLATMNIKHIQADIRGIVHPETVDYPIFANADEQAAIAWLRQHTTLDDVVMASMWDGNLITGLAGRPVVVAHGNQTVSANDRQRDWDQFRAGTTSATERRAIIDRLRVVWVYWTADDQRTSAYRPMDDNTLRPAFVSPTVTIYQVIPVPSQS